MHLEVISFYAKDCRYSDCLHIEGDEHSLGCSVLSNLDKIEPTRYESYLEFLEESREYKQKVTYSGTKEEETKKHTHGKQKAKISRVRRESSRNTAKQKIKFYQIQFLLVTLFPVIHEATTIFHTLNLPATQSLRVLLVQIKEQTG